MTREEAIAILEVSKHMATSGRMYNQAIDMAIEELSADRPTHERDLISRHEVLMELNGACEMWEDDAIVADIIHKLPSIDIVRCKDCCYQVHCLQTVSHTKIHDGFNEYWAEPIEFCSKGERREP